MFEGFEGGRRRSRNRKKRLCGHPAARGWKVFLLELLGLEALRRFLSGGRLEALRRLFCWSCGRAGGAAEVLERGQARGAAKDMKVSGGGRRRSRNRKKRLCGHPAARGRRHGGG